LDVRLYSTGAFKMKQILLSKILPLIAGIFLSQSCVEMKKDKSERIPTVWTVLRDPQRADFTIYLEIQDHKEFKTYEYFESPSKDSLPFFAYQLHFHPDTFLVDQQDTMPLTNTYQTIFLNENIQLYRFDYVNFMIHGDGCYIFSELHGKLGEGIFSGSKVLLKEWGTEKVDFKNILEKQKRHHNNG